MRILLAEDEKDLNKIITARLKDEYYSVDSCFDGKEAEEYLTAVKYDAVILDIMMPKKDGLSVLKEMRRKKDSTPVILLTAKDSVEDRVAGLDAGANDYLVKPFACPGTGAFEKAGGNAENMLHDCGSGSTS